MELTDEQFQANFKGFLIVDCVVRSPDFFYFSLIQDYTSDPAWNGKDHPDEEAMRKRVVVYARQQSDNLRWGHVEITPGGGNFNAGNAVLPKEQFVGVDADGQVYVLGSGTGGLEKQITDASAGGVLRGGVNRCRMISGYAYIAGGGRSVGYREDSNKWISLTDGLPFEYHRDWETAGFRDFDGFDSNDIYCVGGKGDVWHFNGRKWAQIHFPSNINLYSISCAGDGFVYISGYGGTTFKGRGDKWKQLFKQELTLPFRQMVWYKKRLWCTSDYGTWTIENDRLLPAQIDADIARCAGHVATDGNILLLAGHSGAAYLEDGKWKKIF